jgi:hypothetical protein
MALTFVPTLTEEQRKARLPDLPRTDWIDGDEVPVRHGVYERTSGRTDVPGDGSVLFCLYDDKGWHAGQLTPAEAALTVPLSIYGQSLPWRGLTREVK